MKRVLVTGGNSRLAQAVAAKFGAEFELILADFVPLDAVAGVKTVSGDLSDPAFVAEIVQGIDIILHLDPLQAVQRPEADAIDTTTRGTYVLATEAKKASVARFILGSSLRLFERLPAQWNVNENWQPRPVPTLESLSPSLAELSLRECARVGEMRPLCLRFGEIVSDEEIGAQPPDPNWLHLDDALRAIHHALTFKQDDSQPRHANWIFHITAGGDGAKIRLSAAANKPLDYTPQHTFVPTRESVGGQPDTRTMHEVLAPIGMPSRPIRNVVIFGAGGPVGAVVAQELQQTYRLRLTDHRDLADIAREAVPQSEGSPIAKPFDAPHENRVVDVTDYAQVAAACEGMDAIINLTVLRHEVVQAFRVNTLGAYNVMRAAVAHNIRRVVQTGPAQNLLWDEDGYSWDYDVPEALPRPGTALYFHSKFLGQEICRVFAEYYGLEVPNLLFQQFVNPMLHSGLTPFSISWQDSALAIRRALEVPTYPLPYEVLNILCDLPHGKYSNARAKSVLSWQPRDNMEAHYQRA